jgi:hypothetical protein
MLRQAGSKHGPAETGQLWSFVSAREYTVPLAAGATKTPGSGLGGPEAGC